MKENKLNFDRLKIFNLFQDKKYAKISKISKSILKTFAQDKEIYKIIIFSELNEKNFNKAKIVSEKLLDLVNDAETNYIHGNVLKLQNKFKEATIFYEKAIDYKKDYFEAYNNLATSQKNIGLKDKAFENYKHAINLKKNNLEAHYNLANLLYDEKRFDEARENYEKVIEIDNNFPQSYLLIGLINSVQGNFEEAKNYFLKATQKDKFLTEAYVYYVNTRKIDKNDKIIKILEELISHRDLHPKYEQDISFALSKVYFDVENIDLGFKYLKNAKKLYLKKIDFSIEGEKKSFRKVKKFFSLNKFTKIDFKDNYKVYPIFILGMPRSGTSLLEQIISTHSEVFGAGELNTMPKIFYEANWNEKTNPEELFKFVRREYLSNIEKIQTSKRLLIDKMPFNFFSVGFILNSIPEAKIIHMSRNPMAVCWSNYRSNFFDNIGMDYAHKLESIAEYYIIYNEMMNFWREKYPMSLIEVDYDKFVLDYETNSKSVIAKIGLNWENQILKFYENNRAVETNSLLQVRSKVYQDSSQKWKKYEKHLKPIMDILKDNNIEF
ncbi:MAG: tetratricopeptide repeat-containing sulfotransferase family protein [Candidatus Pelagibacter sp.]